MTRREFIEALKVQTSDAAVFGTIANLERAPGRKPAERDAVLSDWYVAISDLDREHLQTALREAAELAVFSFLGVLDGVSSIEDDPQKGDLRLLYIKNGDELLLNDPDQEFLHDSYNNLCQTLNTVPPKSPREHLFDVGHVHQLRAKQTSDDGIDLHAVSPNRQTSNQTQDSPAIALPKNEHRKLGS